LATVLSIQPVSASGTIYVRASGSVEGTDKIVTADNVTYTFIGNLSDSIIVERDNIIIDGNGFTIEGTSSDSEGVNLSGRTNVAIRNTQIRNFDTGVRFAFSSNNNVSGNSIENNVNGILFASSSNNNVNGNSIRRNNYYGVWLDSSSNNSINKNNIEYNNDGILLTDSSNNTLSGNHIAANWVGVHLSDSSNYNSVSRNNITANTVNSISLDSSSNNSVSGNSIANNVNGMTLYSCFNNSISGNNIAENNDYGISLDSSSNNTIYHNNITNNIQVYNSVSTNTWDNDYPSGGNYWSDYTGADANHDGIGNAPYIIDSENRDRYPLIALYITFDAGVWNEATYNIDVISNSTITDFHFNPNDGAFLGFKVTGENGTTGFCRVTIPADLLWVEDGWTITVGNQPITNYTLIPDGDYTYLYFAYDHSTKTVVIQGNHVVPEFSLALLLPLLMMLSAVAFLFAKKQHLKETES
jgi:parallel beta-helix repeat protein